MTRKTAYALALAIACGGGAASAQTAPSNYPDKPIRLVLPYPPGGSTDAIARILSKELHASLGQPVVVENRAGGAGVIASELVAQSPADGYTLFLTGSGPHAINISLFPKLRYHPLNDFDSIALTVSMPLLMVAPANAPFTNVKEFIQHAKTRADGLNYCSVGPGSPSHLAAELFKSTVGIRMTHLPYKGSGPAIVDTIGGVCDVLFDSAISSGPHVRSGKLKALGIAADKPLPSFPEVPTISNAGVKDFTAYTWTALLAPKGTPRSILTRLNADVNRILAKDDVRKTIEGQGGLPGSGSTDDMTAFTRSEIDKWAKVIRDADIRVD